MSIVGAATPPSAIRRAVRRIACAWLIVFPFAAWAQVALEGAVIANGGTSESGAGDVSLAGTIAQPVAGPSGNGSVQLDAGFWHPVQAPRADAIFHDSFED